MSVPITAAGFTNLMTPGLRKAFFDSYDETNKSEAMVPILYSMNGSTRQFEQTLSVSTLGNFQDFTSVGQVQYQDIDEGYKKTFTHNEWTNGFRIKKDAKDDDLYGIFDSLPKQLGTASVRTRETHGASVFNGAFSGTSGPDSLSLCNTAHTSPVSGIANQSNKTTDTLSKTAVSSARLAMKKFYMFNGELAHCMGDTLIVPLDKEEDAWTIISSKGEPETSDNNPNFHFGKYKLIVWDQITSTYNWFMADMSLMKTSLLWFDRAPVQFNQDTAFNTYEERYSAYMRYSYGWSNYTFIYGSAATS